MTRVIDDLAPGSRYALTLAAPTATGTGTPATVSTTAPATPARPATLVPTLREGGLATNGVDAVTGRTRTAVRRNTGSTSGSGLHQASIRSYVPGNGRLWAFVPASIAMPSPRQVVTSQ
jgi:hypothetical protein